MRTPQKLLASMALFGKLGTKISVLDSHTWFHSARSQVMLKFIARICKACLRRNLHMPLVNMLKSDIPKIFHNYKEHLLKNVSVVLFTYLQITIQSCSLLPDFKSMVYMHCIRRVRLITFGVLAKFANYPKFSCILGMS